MINYTVGELLKKAGEQKTRLERRNMLQQVSTPAVHKACLYIFHPDWKINVVGIPIYKPNTHGAGWTMNSLRNEMRRIDMMREGHTKVSPERSYSLLAQILENISEEDALVLESMITKKCKIKGLSLAVVKMAYPNEFEGV